MRALIDNLKIIKITNQTNPDYKVSLKGYKLTYVETVGSDSYYETIKEIKLNEDLIVRTPDKDLKLEIGNVTLRREFEEKYRYDGQLGYIYSKERTEFKLFTPVAREVILVLDNEEIPMQYHEPIWKTTVMGNQEGKKYNYLVRINEDLVSVEDPYAFAAAVDGNYVIDFSKTTKLEKSPVKVDDYREAVIYEGHVRDMTINLDVEEKGLFRGLLYHSKELNNTVIDHIKQLGITHLQLLPVYDFGGVDDLDKDKEYNWGYNPRQYFSVEGWFSKDPNDP